MKLADQIIAWLVLVLGAVHSAFTLKANPAFTLAAMWFLGTGLLVMLVGAVNLLRIRYAGARGVVAVCLATNVVMVAFAAALASRLSLKQNPQAAVVVALLLLEMMFAIIQSARSSTAVVGAR